MELAMIRNVVSGRGEDVGHGIAIRGEESRIICSIQMLRKRSFQGTRIIRNRTTVDHHLSSLSGSVRQQQRNN